MTSIRRAAVALGVLVAVTAVGLTGWLAVTGQQTNVEQARLDPFYTPPDPLPGPPGTLIRTEPLGVSVPGATALRMLYVSERPDGTPAASSGMMFIPDAPAPAGGRPVVAWAHGTVGMGEACAPSRSKNPLQDTANWLNQMMSLGWVVTSTDYVGLGTPGPELYLVKEAEARDVVNSVRAARNLPRAKAGSRYVVWGHSQGGHSSLWTGHLGPTLAPELDLLGVAAAAPAAELIDIMGAQWQTAVAWGIGPEVLISWPYVDPSLNPDQIASSVGLSEYRGLADECTSDPGLLVQILGQRAAGRQFFDVNPTSQPQWRAFTLAQTPSPLPADMPVFMAQGTTDEVVLPWPNAILEQEWCKAGSRISTLWLGDVGHMKAAVTAGPSAVEWIADRFADRPAPRNCDLAPPVAPVFPANAE